MRSSSSSICRSSDVRGRMGTSCPIPMVMLRVAGLRGLSPGPDIAAPAERSIEVPVATHRPVHPETIPAPDVEIVPHPDVEPTAETDVPRPRTSVVSAVGPSSNALRRSDAIQADQFGWGALTSRGGLVLCAGAVPGAFGGPFGGSGGGVGRPGGFSPQWVGHPPV